MTKLDKLQVLTFFFKFWPVLARFSPQPASGRAGLVKSWPKKMWAKLARPILARSPNGLCQPVSQLYGIVVIIVLSNL